MQAITLRLFPGGKQKALTLSYDDGRGADRRLVALMNQYGLKGSFHLNADWLGKDSRIAAEEIADLYRGHEVATHGFQHPSFTRVPRDILIAQMVQDRMALEALTDYPVRGHSYPNGCFNESIAEVLATLGIAYARTTKSHGCFELPDKPLLWHPTCHHSDRLLERTREFLELDPRNVPRLFYVWGHSYEFDRENNWDLFERFATAIGGCDDIWYATNIEIIDYLAAFYRLITTYDGSVVFNPSARAVWIHAAGRDYEVAPGQTLSIK